MRQPDRSLYRTCLIACGLLAAGVAAAQTEREPSAPNPSGKLDKSDGIITPPSGIDQDMTQKPPDIGATMPVIPPEAVTPPGATPDAPKPEPK